MFLQQTVDDISCNDNTLR